MAELTVQERLQPSLLDRLVDDAPEVRTEPIEARVLTKQTLRRAVLRDLAWLFNTTNLGRELDRERYPEAAASVVNYGLPDLAGGFASSVETRQLEASIRQAVLDFEPRILPHSLEVEAVFDRSVLDTHNQLGVVIRGLLWAQPVPLEILLRTQIDLEEGTIQISEVSR